MLDRMLEKKLEKKRQQSWNDNGVGICFSVNAGAGVGSEAGNDVGFRVVYSIL